jgi:hypothetical protein
MRHTWKTLMDGDELLKVRQAGNTGYWWVLKSTDLVDACGEREAAEMSGNKRMLIMADLNLVPGPALVSKIQQEQVVESCGWDGWDGENEEAWIETASSYGLSIPVHHAFGGTPESALRRTLRDAQVDLDGSIDCYLDRPVNRIGQTGREYLAGDMDSCLARSRESDARPRTGSGGNGAQARRVRQSNLSAECFMVQVFGEHACEDCEYRGTPDCGGQNVLRTGRNEHGHAVPVPDK